MRLKNRLLLLLVTLIPMGSHGEIYKWYDQNGVPTFGDTPPMGVEAELIKAANKPASASQRTPAPNSIRDFLDDRPATRNPPKGSRSDHSRSSEAQKSAPGQDRGKSKSQDQKPRRDTLKNIQEVKQDYRNRRNSSASPDEEIREPDTDPRKNRLTIPDTISEKLANRLKSRESGND